MKLFTIGDSISQGFMSLAAARTELSYSTLIARCLGLTPGTDDYPIPVWGKGGLPVNIESLLRELQSRYGNNIFGPIEWAEALRTIGKFLDSVEEHYERGEGNIALPQAQSPLLCQCLGGRVHGCRRLEGDARLVRRPDRQ